MSDMLVTAEVLNEERSRAVKELQNENMSDMLVTAEVLNPERSRAVKELQK